MSRSLPDLLRHILDEVNYLINDSKEISEEFFMRDDRLKRAFSRSLEIIGEASKLIPAEFKEKNPEIAWKLMTRMRDRLIHHYFGVDYSMVWDIVKHDIPELKSRIENVLRSEQLDVTNKNK
jgi:uncharacterized protein with HEPN domain